MISYDSQILVGKRTIGLHHPTYFIADIASNHDSCLTRAKELIWAAKEAGADAAKFQHFKAKSLVSSEGFEQLDISAKHQDQWAKSVYEIYEENEYDRAWDEELALECKKADIHFMTSPYDLEAIDSVEPLVAAYKVGSGDITTPEILDKISRKQQPIFLASGASSMEDVDRAVDQVLENTPRIALMQCNTNYTGSLENFHHINLRVLTTFAKKWPNMVLGLSDHTPGHSTVLAAVALGARCVEKHFTDNNNRVGPDHAFSMTPDTWSEMVRRTREVEASLGDGIKKVQENEAETVIVQRRGLHIERNMIAGESIKSSDLISLRPAIPEGFFPYERNEAVGRVLMVSKKKGEPLKRSDICR